ncbi:hypothetical protein WN51_11240 [Melipona quadrifasciata]|uniref:DH domain-containing protein n=1 Tax=Melipona quadrifasciata TaxID=166423 RepID=A0A0M9A3R3_9HYME|nr:hypothetical protein WN51_11240 [Melipona quadrifasciata]
MAEKTRERRGLVGDRKRDRKQNRERDRPCVEFTDYRILPNYTDRIGRCWLKRKKNASVKDHLDSASNRVNRRLIRVVEKELDMGTSQLPGASPGAISTVVAPVLLKYRVCRPRLLLAGSRAEIDPAADVALLHGEVLLIEDFARQYDPIGDTDRRYRATEKLLHAEEEYLEALCSAKELYARPLARNYPEFHDVIFQPLADLSVVTSEHCQRLVSHPSHEFLPQQCKHLEGQKAVLAACSGAQRAGSLLDLG